MEKSVMERAKALISNEDELKTKLFQSGKLEVKSVIKEDKYPDSVEIDLGGPGNRGKFYFNADEPEVSEMRLERYFDVVAIRDKLAEARKVKNSVDD